jgi:hypothetical protein
MPEKIATGQTSENSATTVANQLLKLSNALAIAEIERFYRASREPIPFASQPSDHLSGTETRTRE